jgi:acylphosphatase
MAWMRPGVQFPSAPPDRDTVAVVVRRRVVVSGRVQGVGFREHCRRRALELGVAGSVRNLADGTVEALVEGSQDAVERMLSWLRVGPRSAVVTGVRVSEEQPRDESGFVIR